jgi:hypothetical protein
MEDLNRLSDYTNNSDWKAKPPIQLIWRST